MAKKHIIIIGAGAAGLFAAGKAAEAGARVTIFEKKERPGRKLRISGKGRCNLTNIAPIKDFIPHFGKNGKFLRQAFNEFFNQDLIAFMRRLGVPTEIERGGRVFPAGNDARLVVDALVKWVKSSGVKIINNVPVTGLFITDGRVYGIKTNGDIAADAVIIATGGKSYPATGSTGDGYDFARRAGHTIIPTRPALVPIETTDHTAKDLQGLSLKNVKASVWYDNKRQAEEFGEMLFTHFGLSGPIIITMSHIIIDAMNDKKAVTVSIDLKPALDEKKLDNRLLRDFTDASNKQFSNILKGLLPAKMIQVCLALNKFDGDKPANQITADERKRLRHWLKDFRFEITGHRGYKEAIVTAGGINLKEVNPRTLESRIVENLYFCGEVLDIDGDTGGYNLQAAFSTGWLAGISAAKK